MMKCKGMLAVLLAVCLMLGCSFSVFAANAAQPVVTVDQALADTGAYLLKTVKAPQVGSIGGEWAVIGLARSGLEVQQSRYDDYYRTVEAYVKEHQGILHDKKYTEYSRVILALTAIGKNPGKVGGYNLLTPLGDFNQVIWQGINGPTFALIALDSGNYEVPVYAGADVQTTREKLIQAIVGQQLPDGGFSLGGTTGDPDITAMALQALAPYKIREDIKPVIDRALDCLSTLQREDGGYESWGTANSESAVQVLVALTALGIDPQTDRRFVKGDGNWLISNLMTFYVNGGGFKHIQSGGADGMATEQAFYGLVAYRRFLDGKTRFYDMQDVKSAGEGTAADKPGKKGFENRNPDVKGSPVSELGKTFKDIANNPYKNEISALASRKILSGVSDTEFQPDRTVTRAEFASIAIKGLGLPLKSSEGFSDVTAGSWYNGYVGAAYAYGIITGRTGGVFAPQDTISREEAAVMLARAAKLCGYDTAVSAGETRDLLAPFEDYVECGTWSREAVAFCLKQRILSGERMTLSPKEPVTRAEIAGMIYRLIEGAGILDG